MSSRFNIYASLLTVVSLMAACSSTPPAVESPTSQAVTPSAAASTPMPNPAPVKPTSVDSTKVATSTTPALPIKPAYLDPSNLLAKEHRIYFEFDAITPKTGSTAVIERHGAYLASMPTLVIKVEGNADERGSAEYNLALGQKRAESVIKALKIYGVKESQVEPMSWGKGHPYAQGHDEAAWAENRRVDLVYPTR